MFAAKIISFLTQSWSDIEIDQLLSFVRDREEGDCIYKRTKIQNVLTVNTVNMVVLTQTCTFDKIAQNYMNTNEST